MTTFSCKGCVAPKRYPGCHDRCPEYQAQKTKRDALKAEYDRKMAVVNGVVSQRSDGVYKAMKNRWKG